MTVKKLYLTKQASNNQWYYVENPFESFTSFSNGIIQIDNKSEIRVDDYGAYVIRFIMDEE